MTGTKTVAVFVSLLRCLSYRILTSIQMPILAYESYEEWRQIFTYIHGETTQRTSIPNPADPETAPNTAAPQIDKDTVLIRGYMFPEDGTRPLHCRRTLDQYSYYMLKSTERRDRDQVVYRWAKRQKRVKVPNQTPILMVDQLWLWVLPDGTLFDF